MNIKKEEPFDDAYWLAGDGTLSLYERITPLKDRRFVVLASRSNNTLPENRPDTALPIQNIVKRISPRNVSSPISFLNENNAVHDKCSNHHHFHRVTTHSTASFVGEEWDDE